MTSVQTNPKVDAFIARATQWHDEMALLRAICLDSGLAEELKWGKPCYAYKGKNVVIIQPFKAYCALLFFKGYLLDDRHGFLVKTGENTLVGRQARFDGVVGIKELEPVLKACIAEAIEVEKSGVETAAPRKEVAIPEELQRALDKNPALNAAFFALTPGRQRGFLFHIGQAKQSATRAVRVDKCIPLILAGKGLLD